MNAIPPRPVTGAELRAMRKAAGYSQRKLAAAIDVAYESINRWENDKKRPSRMAVLAITLVCKEKNPPRRDRGGLKSREENARGR